MTEPRQPAQSSRFRINIEKYERHSAAPLAVLALAFIALWSFQVLVHLDAATWELTEAGILVIWFFFGVDYLVRFGAATNKWHFVRNNLIELAALLLPAFRALRVFRVLVALGILTRVAQSVRGQVNLYLAVVLPMLVYAGSLGVYEAEHNAVGATIRNFDDAVWWSVVTVFTVGYGDLYPITLEGRLIAVVMMLAGFALVSIVVINLAGYMLKDFDIAQLRRPSK